MCIFFPLFQCYFSLTYLTQLSSFSFSNRTSYSWKKKHYNASFPVVRIHLQT